MPLFRYRALDGDGHFTGGEIEAADADEASTLVSERGLTALAIERTSRTSGSTALFQQQVSPRDVTTFVSELALVLRSGLPLTDGLSLLEDGLTRRLGAIVHRVRSDILGGASFVQALQRHPEAFPDDLVAIVRVAEAAGGLDTVLETIAVQRRRAEQLQDKIVGSLRYPAFLLLMSSVVLMFFLLFVVPQFSGVIKDMGGDPGTLVRGIIGLSEGLRDNGNTIGIGLGLALGLGIVLLRRPEVRAWFKRSLQTLPLVRQIAMVKRAAVFCRLLGTLLSQGVTLTEALRVIANLLEDGSGTLDRIIMAVRRGSRLSDALNEETSFLPTIAVRMLRVGEYAGELADVAQRTAVFFEVKLEGQLDRLSAIVGPVAIIAISAIIGTLIVSIMSALLSVNQLVV